MPNLFWPESITNRPNRSSWSRASFAPTIIDSELIPQEASNTNELTNGQIMNFGNFPRFYQHSQSLWPECTIVYIQMIVYIKRVPKAVGILLWGDFIDRLKLVCCCLCWKVSIPMLRIYRFGHGRSAIISTSVSSISQPSTSPNKYTNPNTSPHPSA